MVKWHNNSYCYSVHKTPIRSPLCMMRCSSASSTYYIFIKNVNFRVQSSQKENRKWVSSCSNKHSVKQQLHACLSVHLLIKLAAHVCQGIKYKLHYHSVFDVEAPPTTRGVCDEERERLFIIPSSALCLLFPTLHYPANECCMAKLYVYYRVSTLYSIHTVCFTFFLSLHPDHTTQPESHFPRYSPMGGTDSRFQADIACNNHMLHKALSHVCVSESSGFTV